MEAIAFKNEQDVTYWSNFPVNSLPGPILLQIFDLIPAGELPNLRSVCKQWLFLISSAANRLAKIPRNTLHLELTRVSDFGHSQPSNKSLAKVYRSENSTVNNSDGANDAASHNGTLIPLVSVFSITIMSTVLSFRKNLLLKM